AGGSVHPSQEFLPGFPPASWPVSEPCGVNEPGYLTQGTTDLRHRVPYRFTVGYIGLKIAKNNSMLAKALAIAGQLVINQHGVTGRSGPGAQQSELALGLAG